MTESERGRRDAEIERIRSVYKVRDAASARHPAIAAAYRRLNAERTRAMHDLILTVAPPSSGRILDVGCGTGYDLAQWVRDGWQIDLIAGVDISPERVARARAACPGADIRLGDGIRLPFREGIFDAVTASTVFSSILDPMLRSTVFREMERVARPGGLVVVYDFVLRKPTNASVHGLSLRRLAELGRAPTGSRRLSPVLQLVAAADVVHPRMGDLAMRLLPRTHRLSWWTVPETRR